MIALVAMRWSVLPGSGDATRRGIDRAHGVCREEGWRDQSLPYDRVLTYIRIGDTEYASWYQGRTMSG